MVKPAKASKAAQEAQAQEEESLKMDMQELVKKLPKVLRKKDKVNDAMRALNQQKAEGNMHGARNKQKTSALTQQAIKTTQAEVVYLQKMLFRVQELRKKAMNQKMSGPMKKGDLMNILAEQADGLPLYIRGLAAHSETGGVGGLPFPDSHILQEGDYCAAFVEDNWILGEVVRYNGVGRYDVKDIEEDDKVMAVTKKKLIPLPTHRADPQRMANALFPTDAIILALYPQTTCFYKGCVVEPPKGPTDKYTIAFEDSTFPDGWSDPLPVPQRYVLTYQEIKQAKKRNDAA